MKNNISNEMLGIIFKRLRAQEGINAGSTTKLLEPELIYKILINARYKQEKQIAMSDLEIRLRNESGDLIKMYIAEKWTQLKGEEPERIPFPEIANKSLRDVEKLVERQRLYTCRVIA